MTRLKFALTVPAICAALLLTACGGDDGGSAPATSAAPATPAATWSISKDDSWKRLGVPSSPQAMAGYANLGNTCYANAALKLLMHSIGPKELKLHLNEFAQKATPLQRDAAQGFVDLIDKSYSDNGPTRQELADFFGTLQQLPAFSSTNPAGALNFKIVGQAHDIDDFLGKLSESFALDTVKGLNLKLGNDDNQFKQQEEYWTILKPASSDSSLQDLFDRTQDAGWQYAKSGDPTQRLTVKIDFSETMRSLQKHSNRPFDFNQTVRLQFTEGDTTTTLTLEPREVVEFVGNNDGGHYVVYAKDDQWIRYDDDQVTVQNQMPDIDNAFFINFAIREVANYSKTHSSTSSGS